MSDEKLLTGLTHDHKKPGWIELFYDLSFVALVDFQGACIDIENTVYFVFRRLQSLLKSQWKQLV